MKYFAIAMLLATVSAITLEKMDPSTGKPINVCNGLNDGDCQNADEINTKRIRRPHKRAAPGDKDYPAQEKADAAMMGKKGLAQKSLPTCTDRITVNCQPVCTDSYTTGCTEARTPTPPQQENHHQDRYEGARPYHQ